MAEDNIQNNNVYNENDTLDINELAALNDDISTEFIEQLQSQVSLNATKFNNSTDSKDVTELFEEVPESSDEPTAGVAQDLNSLKEEAKQNEEKRAKIDIDNTFDDNFIKKYKAKLNKQQSAAIDTPESIPRKPESEVSEEENNDAVKVTAEKTMDSATAVNNGNIENLTSGNIIEKPASKEQISYNDSLDFLDNNVKYSKYVIYIDPENTEFVESLTVKERKNLINRILREQDDIAITKRRVGIIQMLIKHTIIAIITVAIAIPVVYFTINASLEASINNYRRSQTIFKTLYKERGKIKTNVN